MVRVLHQEVLRVLAEEIQVPLDVVRGENHDDVRLRRSLGRGEDTQALFLRLRAGPGIGLQADADVHPGIAEVQRVRMAL